MYFCVLLFLFPNKLLSSEDSFIIITKNFLFSFEGKDSFLNKGEILKVHSFDKSNNARINYFNTIIEIKPSYYEKINLNEEQKNIYSFKHFFVRKNIKNKVFIFHFHNFFETKEEIKNIKFKNESFSVAKLTGENKCQLESEYFKKYLRLIIPNYPSLFYYNDSIKKHNFIDKKNLIFILL